MIYYPSSSTTAIATQYPCIPVTNDIVTCRQCGTLINTLGMSVFRCSVCSARYTLTYTPAKVVKSNTTNGGF